MLHSVDVTGVSECCTGLRMYLPKTPQDSQQLLYDWIGETALTSQSKTDKLKLHFHFLAKSQTKHAPAMEAAGTRAVRESIFIVQFNPRPRLTPSHHSPPSYPLKPLNRS
jgi:hypothetical protein